MTPIMTGWLTHTSCYVIVSLVCVHWVIQGAAARRKREKHYLQFKDCGKDSKLINFHHVNATPQPIIVPGTLYVSMAGNLTSDLPRRLNVQVNIKKYFFGYPFLLPCLHNNIGSCTYENICHTLEYYESLGCPRTMLQEGISCYCPFAAGSFDFRNLPINLPKVHGFASALLNGDYEFEIRIQEEDGEELGCLHMKFSIKKRHRGWLFKI